MSTLAMVSLENCLAIMEQAIMKSLTNSVPEKVLVELILSKSLLSFVRTPCLTRHEMILRPKVTMIS